MDVYQNLLEDYDKIKKRKFKLRLDEEMIPPPMVGPELAGQVLQASLNNHPEAIDLFTEIDNLIPSIFEILPKQYKKAIPVENEESFRAKIIGSDPESLESVLANSIRLSYIQGSQIISNPVPKSIFIGVVRTLKRLFQALAKTNVESDLKDLLVRKLKLSSDGWESSVAIYSIDSCEDGLILRSEFLSFLLEELRDRCSIQISSLNVSKNEDGEFSKLVGLNSVIVGGGTEQFTQFSQSHLDLKNSIQAPGGVTIDSAHIKYQLETIFDPVRFSMLVDNLKGLISKDTTILTYGHHRVYVTDSEDLRNRGFVQFNDIKNAFKPSFVRRDLLDIKYKFQKGFNLSPREMINVEELVTKLKTLNDKIEKLPVIARAKTEDGNVFTDTLRDYAKSLDQRLRNEYQVGNYFKIFLGDMLRQAIKSPIDSTEFSVRLKSSILRFLMYNVLRENIKTKTVSNFFRYLVYFIINIDHEIILEPRKEIILEPRKNSIVYFNGISQVIEDLSDFKILACKDHKSFILKCQGKDKYIVTLDSFNQEEKVLNKFNLFINYN